MRNRNELLWETINYLVWKQSNPVPLHKKSVAAHKYGHVLLKFPYSWATKRFIFCEADHVPIYPIENLITI